MGEIAGQGTVKIQVRKGHRGRKMLKRRSVRDGEMFMAPCGCGARRRLRAEVGSETSLTWKEKG